MTYLFRPVKEEDIDSLEKFANLASIGFLNLPKSRRLLEIEIQASLSAFKNFTKSKKGNFYLFVLEDLNAKKVIGCSGIISQIGRKFPVCFYRIKKRKGEDFLVPVCYKNGPSEICALYLLKEFRKSGVGRILSLSRFLFIANFPNYFEKIMTAEMRGFIDEEEKSPFWNALKERFNGVEYATIQHLIQEDKSIISQYMLKDPMLISSLPKSAQEVIGKTHPNTVPALYVLQSQGFSFSGEVDLFDAGPKISADTASILSVAQSTTGIISAIKNIAAEDTLVSNTDFSFKATLGAVKVQEEGYVIVSPEVAETLKVDVGEKIRYIKK